MAAQQQQFSAIVSDLQNIQTSMLTLAVSEAELRRFGIQPKTTALKVKALTLSRDVAAFLYNALQQKPKFIPFSSDQPVSTDDIKRNWVYYNLVWLRYDNRTTQQYQMSYEPRVKDVVRDLRAEHAFDGTACDSVRLISDIGVCAEAIQQAAGKL